MRKLLTTFMTLALLAVGAALAFSAVQGSSGTPASNGSAARPRPTAPRRRSHHDDAEPHREAART